MLNLSLVLAVQSTVPATSEWTPGVGLVMILCNLLAIAIGRYAIANPGIGPDIPASKPALFRKFGLPELLATMSFGHILGVGAILGLSNAGVL